MLVPISSIIIPTNPPRIRANPEYLTGLAENIRRYGMLNPILVTEINNREDERTIGRQDETASVHPSEAVVPSSINQPCFALIAGYRRLKAAESIGWTEVPVTIQAPHTKEQVPNPENAPESDSASAISALTEFDLQVCENVHRRDLTPIEISDAIFERKHRFEQIFGPIKHGGDRTKVEPEESKLHDMQLAPPDFYEQTGRLFRMSESAIYQLLRLQGIEPDLKLKVETREMGYQAALAEQAKRNQERKKPKKSNASSGRRISGIPDQKTAEVYLAMYQKSPKLFQIFQLVNHSLQYLQRFQEYQHEYPNIDLELLHNFIVQLKQLMAVYTGLITDLEKTLDQHLNAMMATELPPADIKSEIPQ